MAETIYTIPINEAFDKYDGCPLCRLHRDLENAALEYVMGAAMMEPDVRIRTNELGFCREHFDRMLEMKNRLGFALIMESHLEQIRSLLTVPESGGRKLFGSKKESQSPGDALLSAAGSCFVCDRIKSFEDKYISNIVHLWKSDSQFREKLKKQPEFCLYHSGRLMSEAGNSLSGEKCREFSEDVISVVSGHASALADDLSGFIKSFDHRFASVPLTDAQRQSAERIAELLSGK